MSRHVERVTESEFFLTVGAREWVINGWKADLLGAVMVAPLLFVFIVGLATVVGWFL